MSMRNWVALGLSILVAGVCLYLPFVPQTVLPFDTRPLDRQHYLVRPSAYDMPLPAGLQAGDVIDARAMDVSSRLGITTYAVPPVGTRVTLVVNREGHAFNVPVEFTRMPRIPLNLADTVSGIALIWLVAALGLLILWRGKRLAAAGVGIWCLAKLCWEIPISLPWTLPVAGWVDVSGMALYYSGTLVGLYLLAEDLVCERVPAQTRRRARAAFLALVIIYLLGFVSNDLAFHLRGFWLFNPAYINARVVAHLLAFAIPIGMLVLRYRQAAAGDRARIRWVLVSIVGVVAAYLVNGTLAAFLDEYQSDILYSVFTAVASIGFTYAVLRHRLVAVNVVLNRALVYGVALTMLVAIFGVLESLLEHAALGERASLLLTLAVPLVLGILFNQLHKRFEHGMEYLFFRKQFRAEAALAQFAKECGYITSVRVLLDRTESAVMRQAGAPAVAIYEHAGGDYRRLRQAGARDFPERLGVDDPACVRLRANLAETDLEDLQSALGRDGLAFPVALRGVLLGMLVCAPRPGELYTPKERGLLAHLAHEVGASLHAMYVTETRAFLQDVANGTRPSADSTRSAAQQLVHMAPAA